MVAVASHMDDCLTTGTSQSLVDEFKQSVNSKYRMTDLGPCKWLLGIKIDHDFKNGTIALLSLSWVFCVQLSNGTRTRTALTKPQGCTLRHRVFKLDTRLHYP